MATVTLISDAEATPEVRAVFDDIRATRGSDFINNFWRALANDPALLSATWQRLKSVMGPGTLDPPDQGTDLYRRVGRQWLRILRPFPHRSGPRQGHDPRTARRVALRHRHGIANQRPRHRSSGAGG